MSALPPFERAAMRERYAADLPSAWDTSAAAHARALRDLGTSARNDVPRLLGALDAAEAEVARLRAALPFLTAAPSATREDPLREALARTVAHDGPGHPYGDAAYCGGCLAEREANQ